MSAQSRRLRNGLISLAIFFALVAALLLAVPGLRSAGGSITDAKLGWVGAGIGFELLSCAGYVVLFELVFKMERVFSRRLSLAELGVNSVVSIGGIGGIALGAWVLRTKGVAVERIAQALGPDVRAHERSQRGRRRADRRIDVARAAPRLPECPAHAAAGGIRYRGDRRDARRCGARGPARDARGLRTGVPMSHWWPQRWRAGRAATDRPA